MRERIEVEMDGPGAIEPNDTHKEIFTTDFSGCTAFYAKTDQGYGLYHMRSTRENRDNSFNQNFKEWLNTLKSYQGQDKKIHFELGTPCTTIREEQHGNVFDTHPLVGMETYLKQLCQEESINDYTISFLDMSEVKNVFATVNGTMCSCYSEPYTPKKAKYQNDEQILQGLEELNGTWTKKRSVEFIVSDPHMGSDPLFKEKYREEYELYCQELSAKRDALLAKIQRMISFAGPEQSDLLKDVAEAVRKRDFNFLCGDIIEKPYYRGKSTDEETIYREAIMLTGKSLSGELEPIPEALKTTTNTMQITTQYKNQLMDSKTPETDEEVNTNRKSGDCTIL
ncbi:hypothetical protein [Legionella rowbothamii]|uniref:hypothetical protein n=1 Tax=Legionella rowbothamii TaxID=96229 RepID=UPI00105448FA|nr:hypothetical protein [Legionella rowbothamii]